MQKYLLLVVMVVATQVLAQVKLSVQNAPALPALFGEGIISTSINERDFALSPDGAEIFYTISTPKSSFQTIVFSKKLANGTWSTPEVAPFAGQYSDLEPAFTADGRTVFFASNRPISGTAPKDFDIWKVSRTASGWGVPENLGPVVNTSSDEFYPSITASGNLYFTAAYKGGPGREDIYVATWRENAYQKPVPMDTAVNTKFFEFNAFVSPKEDFILFTSYGRKDDAGGGDLYMAVKDANGQWQSAKNLKALNSKQLDYCPFVTPDGRVLFFTSERHQLPVNFTDAKASYQKVQNLNTQPLNGTGNIYWVDFVTIMGGGK